MSWYCEDRKPTPPGCKTHLTLQFDVFFHYNMGPDDVAAVSLEAKPAILELLRKTAHTYELKKYGSRSDVITFSGISVG